MNNIRPVARYFICVSAAAACAAAVAMCSPHEDAWDFVATAEAKTAYLDCTRIAPAQVLEPDLVTVCSVVAGVRDGGPARA